MRFAAIVTGAALAAILSLVRVGPASAGQNLHVFAITCPDAVYFKTRATATLYVYGPSNKAMPVPLTERSPGYYVGTVSVAPGHYSLAVRDGFCDGGARVTVLPDYDRHIGLILREHSGSTYDFESYVAGALPIHVTNVYLLAPNGAEIPLDLDNGAIYGEGLPVAKYVLRLLFYDPNLECRIPISLNHGGNVLHIEPGDIRRNMGHLIKYASKPAIFELLWPTNPMR
jgi:hypothetical protein